MGRKFQTATSRGQEVVPNVVTAQPAHATSYRIAQRAIRKKADPVANRVQGVGFGVTENDVSVANPSVTVQPHQQGPVDVFSRSRHVAPYLFDTINPSLLNNVSLAESGNKYLKPNVKHDPSPRQSTPTKKRPHEGSDNESTAASPTKRQRERVNEKAARAKRNASEKALSESRAALPPDYRAIVEKEVPQEFGPRTREFGGENSTLDAKMFIADVMARSAVSLRHLGLILKHNGLDVLHRSIAKEEMEKGKTQGAGPVDSNTSSQPLTNQGTEELIQNFASFDLYQWDWEAQILSTFTDISNPNLI